MILSSGVSQREYGWVHSIWVSVASGDTSCSDRSRFTGNRGTLFDWRSNDWGQGQEEKNGEGSEGLHLDVRSWGVGQGKIWSQGRRRLLWKEGKRVEVSRLLCLFFEVPPLFLASDMKLEVPLFCSLFLSRRMENDMSIPISIPLFLAKRPSEDLLEFQLSPKFSQLIPASPKGVGIPSAFRRGREKRESSFHDAGEDWKKHLIWGLKEEERDWEGFVRESERLGDATKKESCIVKHPTTWIMLIFRSQNM